MIDLKQIAEQLGTTGPQITRETKLNCVVAEGITMYVKTVVTVTPDGPKNEKTTIEFYDKASGGGTPIVTGTVFEMLKERYFKPEMVIF